MDECAVKAHNNCHPENAECINEEGTFTCRCKPGNKDTGGPFNPGRQCPNQCKPNPCKHGTCLRTNEVGDPVCMCPADYRGKFCEEEDPLTVLPQIGASVRTSSRLVLIVVAGLIVVLALPLLCCCCCFCCPVRTEYAKLLNERILATKSIAERRRERDEAERARLEEAQRKIDLRNEFFNIDDGKLDKADLIEMGATSATFNVTEGDATSIPEDKHVTSQRFNDSASVIDTAGMTDQTVTAGGGIPANLESGPLTSFAGQIIANTLNTLKHVLFS